MENHCKVDQAAIVLFSGGQDSTTCLFWAKNKFKDVYALSFDFMQKNIIELEYAKKICEEYMIPYETMDLSVLDAYKQKSVNDDVENHKYSKGIKLAEQINKYIPTVRVLGGAAGFKEKRRSAYVLESVRISSAAAAAAFIASEELSVYENYVCGAESTGQSRRVTGISKSHILEVDGKTGEEWYSQLLDKEELRKDEELSLLFPVIRQTDIKTTYFTELDRKKAGGLHISCELPKNSVIYAGYFDPQKTLAEMQTMYRDLSQTQSELLFAYDCPSRMVVMHSCAKWEAEQFTSTSISGALLSGEIVYYGGKNRYANFIFAVAGLSENPATHIPLRSRDLTDCTALRQNNIREHLKTGLKRENG